MDSSSEAWLPELEMDQDPHNFMNQRDPYNIELADSFSSQNFKGYVNLNTRNQSNQVASSYVDMIEQELSKKATRVSSFAPICGSASNTNFTISFGDKTTSSDDAIKSEDDMMSLNEVIGCTVFPTRVGSTRGNRRQAQEHVLAERKRREKLTQRFISLSLLLPEIKKMDKAMVLEDASNYIKELQNRVKELEESSLNTGKTVFQESTNSKKRFKYNYNGLDEDVASSFNDTNNILPSSSSSSTAYYESGIKARISGNNVLVTIYCRDNSTLALKALTEMERLHFIIICNSVLLVPETSALITIIAQMREEFFLTATDLVKRLQSSLSSFL